MTRERGFWRRGKWVTLREIAELTAFRPPDESIAGPTGAAPRAAASSRLSQDKLEAVAPEVLLPQLRTFEDAGWTFQVDATREIPAGALRAQVLLTASGQLALSTNKLTVKFKEDISRDEADRILEEYGCRVLEKLSFAPGLFRVALTDSPEGEDSFDVANRLVNDGVCEFAEPELIEVQGHRRSVH